MRIKLYKKTNKKKQQHKEQYGVVSMSVINFIKWTEVIK